MVLPSRLERVEVAVHQRRHLLHAVVYLGALSLASPADLSNLVAAAVVATGVLLRIWAGSHIHKDVELATEGPYAIVRHPLYMANLMIFAGIALAANNVVATAFIAVTVGVAYWLAIRYEERHLREQFGAAYDEYAVRVPAVIPRLAKATLSLRTGSVRPRKSRLASLCMALLLIAIFELKEELLEHHPGIEFSPVWGVAMPAIIMHL